VSNKLKLTKIELTTKDGKKVELSLDEAKDLHDQLHELFGQKTVFVPGAPVIIERDRYWRPYQPYWGGGGGGGSDQRTWEVLCKSSSGLAVTYGGQEA
jgi:hypothetical protein